MNKGLIFNIQKYSIHDGPGIRTTVFLKGCPLNCWWCHNPEGISTKKEIIINSRECIQCRSCVETCSRGAVVIKNGIPVINRVKCKKCGNCTEVCPTNALEMAGKEVSVKEVMQDIKNDRIFYEESGGGVTFSGGEPLKQTDFLMNLLTECNKEGIHTVVDTSGYVEWEKLNKIAAKVDLFLYDLKFINNESHKKYTGINNKQIIYNLKMLSKTGSKIIVRIPVIPAINDTDNIKESGKFLSKIAVEEVDILPYHKIGSGKYEKLGMYCQMPETVPPSESKMEEIASRLNKFGLKVKIGG